MSQLHETLYGKRLLERDIPDLVATLQQVVKELRTANELKKYELTDKAYANGDLEKVREIKNL